MLQRRAFLQLVFFSVGFSGFTLAPFCITAPKIAVAQGKAPADQIGPLIVAESVLSSDAQAGLQSFFRSYGLTRNDYRHIVANVDNVAQAIPSREMAVQARRGENVVNANIVGTAPPYFDVHHLKIARGRAIIDEDLKTRRTVCVLGGQAAARLFPFREDPIGKTVRIQGSSYWVVGVSGDSRSVEVYIPLTTMHARMGDMTLTTRRGTREGFQYELSRIDIVPREAAQAPQIQAAVQQLLRSLHKDDSYRVSIATH